MPIRYELVAKTFLVVLELFSFNLFYQFQQTNNMEYIQAVVDPSKQFAKDSIRLVKRCTKPDRKGSSIL